MSWIARNTVKRHKIDYRIIIAMAVVHVVTTVVYMVALEGDWKKYYDRGVYLAQTRSSFDYVKPGTKFIVGISHALNVLEKFDLSTMFAVFSLVGFTGSLYFIRTLSNVLGGVKHSNWYYLALLPGIHFWASAIGKDAIMFLTLNIVFFCLTCKRIPVAKVVGAMVVTFMVRPHIAFILALAMSSAVFLARSNRIAFKVAFCVGLGIAMILTLPYVQNFVGIQEISIEAASNRLEYAASKNQTGGGAVDLTSYPPHYRIFTYLYRPLFIDARGLTGVAASCENLLLLGLSLSLVNRKFFAFLKSAPNFWKLCFLFFASVLLFILGMSTANLGLAMRQKFQFLPCFLCLAAAFHHWRRQPRSRNAFQRS